MKKFTFLAFFLLVVSASWKLNAQKNANSQELKRCATMERLDVIYSLGIGLDETPKRNSTNNNSGQNDNYRLQAIVTIPVVVHIVMPNPFIITDADVQAQIDRLNLDFLGLNPDSTNASGFYGVRGHSQIQFCLARRTPSGQLTNGIERRASNTASNVTLATDPIKRTSLGGLDVWNPSEYLNIWVGADASGQGILGYAQFPGTGAAADDGVVLNFLSFGSSSCYTDPTFNKGRTATHEVGHYLGLYHIWGDESGCTGDDFRQLPNVGPGVPNPYQLPATLFNPAGQGNTATDIGDTPNQAGATNSTCPTGVVTDACSPASPGKMYQNQMDYSADACLTLFTNKQVGRMEWCLDNARAGLKTSLGCQPPTGAITLDASPLASVNPGGFEVVGCNVTSYPTNLACAGSFAPKFRIVNNGLTTITSVTVGYQYDNGTAVTQNISVTIPSGATYVHTFNTTVSATIGSHTLKFFTSQPNGSTDQLSANDTLTQTFGVNAPVTPPLTEGFETAAPFTNFTIDNPNGDGTWQRTTPGRGGSAGKLTIDNYNIDNTGTFDDVRSTSITVNPAFSYSLSFDLAHKNYPAAVNSDTLSVLISTNCGQAFTSVYKKWGATLATAGSSTAGYATPAAADWRTETINLPGSVLSSGQIIVAIRNSGRFGNYIHIDNINVSLLGSRDLRLVSINTPGATSCSSLINPSVTVANDGTETVTAFKVGYRIDNGANTITTFTQTIAPGATATVSLPQGTATSGVREITAFTADPVSVSGTGDGKLSNDTLKKSFTVINLRNLPVTEGFETSFPPSGWTIFNPNNNGTWIRRTPGRNSANSAFIDNWTTGGLIGQIDEMRLPFMNIAGADSVIVTFDVAHRNYPGSNDSLRVLATTDCGNTFTSVYGKAGATLATGPSFTGNFVAPTAAQWRNERIALGGTVLSTGSLGINFRNRNDFGNNTFIDNINISALFKRDLQLLSIDQPGTLICANTVTPSVTVRNVGSETITAFKVSYSINNGTPVTQTVSSVSLARNAQMTVALPAATALSAGGYNLRIYSWEPVTAGGTGDMNTSNDTLSKTFSIPGTANAPLSESFVGTAFPPANWSVLNPDGGISWTRSANGNGNAGSAFVNTFNYQTAGQRDDLAMPIISYPAVDSVRLSFDVAASTYSYPGSTAVPIDTLEVLVTKDCGNTFTSVYKKWGNELQTISDPNAPQTTEFFPATANQWRMESIDLTQYAAQSPLLVMFRVSNNFENNIFIDNVNFTTRTVPAQLKQQGYVIYPTAFANSFTVWHYQTPSTVKYINVVNSAGQTVWSKQFNGNADKQVSVDLNGKAAGVYVVEVGYVDSNKNVVQRVVKY